MKLAYSTNAFTRTDLFTAIEKVSELGFDGVEILCDHPHWHPGKVTAQELQDCQALLQKVGLGVSNLNANTANIHYDPLPPENIFEPSLHNADETLRQWRQNYTIEALKLAKVLNARAVSVTSGHPNNAMDPEESLALFIDSLKIICREAERLQVPVGIEYEPGLLVERGSEALAVIEAVNSPMLGINLDIGHSYLDGESPEATIESFAGRIWNVHVEDIRGKKHFHLVPGEGDLPFERYFKALDSIAYDGYLTVEVYTYPNKPEEVGQKSHRYLKNLLSELF